MLDQQIPVMRRDGVDRGRNRRGALGVAAKDGEGQDHDEEPENVEAEKDQPEEDDVEDAEKKGADEEIGHGEGQGIPEPEILFRIKQNTPFCAQL
jgi:hypothetical protein